MTVIEDFTTVYPKRGYGRIHHNGCWRATKGEERRPLTPFALRSGRAVLAACCETHAITIDRLAGGSR